MNADELLTIVERIYATANRYQDNGRVETVLDNDLHETMFSTFFEHERMFNFYYEAPHPFPPKKHKRAGANVIWANGDGRLISWDYQARRTSNSIESIQGGIASLTGVSKGAAMMIPSLLFPDLELPKITRLNNAEFNDTEDVYGMACNVICGEHESLQHVKMWVGADDCLIYKIETNLGGESSIQYCDEPRINENAKRRAPLPARLNISSRTLWESTIGYYRAVRMGNHTWVAGTTASDEDGAVIGHGNAAEQTRYVLQKIDHALHEAGASMRDVVRTRMFVTSIADWDAIGRVHGEFFSEICPASTMVEVSKLIDPEHLVEIEVDAYLIAK